MRLIFILLCTSILVHISVSVGIWEFGHQVEGDQVIEHHKSTIETTEKTKHIQLHVPTCSRLTYVKVMIDNLVSSPKVLFDKNVNLLTIAYGLHQNSWSNYHVVVKAIDDGCKKNTKNENEKRKDREERRKRKREEREKRKREEREKRQQEERDKREQEEINKRAQEEKDKREQEERDNKKEGGMEDKETADYFCQLGCTCDYSYQGGEFKCCDKYECIFTDRWGCSVYELLGKESNVILKIVKGNQYLGVQR